jgi:excisionase family DNA binding protein
VNPPESIISHLKTLRAYLTVEQTAKILGRHRETVYVWIASGLPAWKQKRTWRIDPIRLAAWLEKQ